MTTLPHLTLLKVCLFLLAVLPANLSAEDVYQVGVAQVDVTPDYPIRLNGFGFRRKESEGVTQRIWAKALAISYGEDRDAKPVVLITLDSLGVRMSMVDEVAARLRKKFEIPRERLALTFTHSHTTPKVNGASDNIFSQPIPAEHQKHIDRYTRELTDHLEKAALMAVESRRPARLQWAVGSVGFAKNRRTVGGPVDHSLPVLFVRDLKGKIFAVYTTYACHCVTLSHNKISGDWAGYAQDLLQRKFPGAAAMVSIGCGSDSNPLSGVVGDRVDVAIEQGSQIADEAARLAQGKLRHVAGKVTARLRRISLPLQGSPSRNQLEITINKGGSAGYNAQTQLARLDRGQTLPTTVDYPLQSFTFGQSLHMAFLAGEVCVDYSLRLKREMDQNRIWLHGYSNDFCCYIPSERLLKEGGYGGGSEIPYFALPSKLQPGLEQKIIDEVKRQTPKEFLNGSEQNSEQASQTQGVPPQSPEESLRCMKTHDDLQIELVVAEPLIADPVAIDFGPDGRLWVAEMADYAHPVDAKFKQTGRIKFLRDASGDGEFDTAAVFVEGLRFPTDVKVWRQGVLVCDAPEILYFEDADEDGRAEIRKVLYRGFATHNPHARVNSLRYGLDNWVYGSGGLFGGEITSFSGKTANVTNRDFRLHPDTGEIEAAAGRTQQGRSRDDWDNWFGCSNGTLLRYYPVADHYYRRNPHTAPPAPEVYVPDYPNSHRLYPRGEVVLFKLSGAAGRPTSACGLGVYRDTWLGADYLGNTFTCEPVNQLVHRQVVSRRGAVFKGRRSPNERRSEFLTSTDRWFRPVQVRTGLDGALWIVDMYRYVIEHPRWIPDETKAELDLFAGQERGRIFRIRPKGESRPNSPPLSKLSLQQLAAAMDSPNGTKRDLIQQMIIWRKAYDGAPALGELVRSAKTPQARLQAACTLAGLGKLTPADVLLLLNDPHPEVRRHAVRLSEPFLNTSNKVLDSALKLADDPAVEVRLQLAYSLGQCRNVKASAGLAALGAAEAGDVYLRGAVLSSVQPRNVELVIAESLKRIKQRAANPFLRSLLSCAASMGDAKTAAQVVEAVAAPNADDDDVWRMKAMAQVFEAMGGRTLGLEPTMSTGAKQATERLFQRARKLLSNDDAPSEHRLAAISLLGHGNRIGMGEDDLQPLASLLSPQTSLPIQSAAVTAIGNRGEEKGARRLLAVWDTAAPTLRSQILQALLSRRLWIDVTLNALKSGSLRSGDFDAAARQRLLSHPDKQVAEKAKQAFAAGADPDRARIVQQWRSVINQDGDPERGREVFQKQCANCHKMDGKGVNVGPDLEALTQKSTAFLLTAVLDPSRDVDARYLNYLAIRDDGRGFAGLLANETTNSITIREAGGKETVILRRRLEELRATGKSFMPDGLEKEITPQQMYDLLAYVMGLGPAPKKFAGNTPRIILPDERGQLTLGAAQAEIFGGDIQFESNSPFRNIGHWHGENDRAGWRVRTEHSALYDVYLDWSCTPTSAGNRYRLEGGDSAVTGVIESTGGWDQYRRKKIGQLELPSGLNLLSLRPDGKLTRRALLDLRAIHLVPAGAVARLEEPAPVGRTESSPAPTNPALIAKFLLDDSNSTEARQKLIAERPKLAAEILAALTKNLPHDPKEEYRRIPWIWRVAVAAGKRGDDNEIHEVLNVSLPGVDQPLRDWQAVVVGGGVINGLSLSGIWPKERIEKILAKDKKAIRRWRQSIPKASKMTDDEKVKHGTRYDALRMIAMAPWNAYGPQLTRYLAKGVPHELQMGAVSGISDLRSPQAAGALLSGMGHYSDRNRELALGALLRTKDRTQALLEAIAAGHVDAKILGEDRKKRLLNHPDAKIKERAGKLLTDSP